MIALHRVTVQVHVQVCMYMQRYNGLYSLLSLYAHLSLLSLYDVLHASLSCFLPYLSFLVGCIFKPSHATFFLFLPLSLSLFLFSSWPIHVHVGSGDLATHVIATWRKFLSNAYASLSCSNGPCYPVYQLFAQFTDLVCGNLLTGLDVYWMSLFYVFILSLLMVILLLLFSW